MIINGTDIHMIRGDTEQLTISCRTADGQSRPFVSGDKVQLTVAWRSGGEPVLAKTIEDFTPDGTAVILLSHTDTNLLQATEYRYDVQLTAVDGAVVTIIPPSKFVVEGDVTRD